MLGLFSFFLFCWAINLLVNSYTNFYFLHVEFCPFDPRFCMLQLFYFLLGCSTLFLAQVSHSFFLFGEKNQHSIYNLCVWSALLLCWADKFCSPKTCVGCCFLHLPSCFLHPAFVIKMIKSKM